MQADYLANQVELPSVNVRQKHSEFESRDSRKKPFLTTKDASSAIMDALIPIPGIAFMAPQFEGAPPIQRQPSMETTEAVPVWAQATIMLTALPQIVPFQASQTHLDAALPSVTPALSSSVLTVEALHNERAEGRQRSSFLDWLSCGIYRIWLIGITALLTLLLFELQSILDHVHRSISIWHTALQWAELSWLLPVPLAFILWLGWFLFAEAARGNPMPIQSPRLPPSAKFHSFGIGRPVRLVFRLVTRGDNVEVLRDSVAAIQRAFAYYPRGSGPYRIEIVTECPIDLDAGSDQTYIYVVPRDYVTLHGSKFKARALTYLQSQVDPQPEDWFIYLDEESLVDEHMLAGLYRFVRQTIEDEASVQKKCKHAGLIGQGSILYQGGNWFFQGADALRTADDLGRFRLQYALGVPMFGIHGSYIVIRGMDDKRLSFDVGAANSITEDAAWALRAWARGYRFAWVEGYMHEQPPQKVKDFVRQRSRWLSGIRIVIRDKQTPLRYRLCLGFFTMLWQLAFLPFFIAILALVIHASPFGWMRIPADFAWATFFLSYLQGLDIQARHGHPFVEKKPFEKFWTRITSWLLVLCSIWYSLLEAWSVIYSLKPKQGFFVIQKPSLTYDSGNNTVQSQPVEDIQSTQPLPLCIMHGGGKL